MGTGLGGFRFYSGPPASPSANLKSPGDVVRVERQFLGMLAERYYSLMHQVVRKYDPQALILGDRFPSCYYPEVVRACAPYVDAISSNLNPTWNDGSFPRFYLDTLYALSGKPVIIGEFYVAARENRSGNRNNRGVGVDLDPDDVRKLGQADRFDLGDFHISSFFQSQRTQRGVAAAVIIRESG